jgi:hypothetical protein
VSVTAIGGKEKKELTRMSWWLEGIEWTEESGYAREENS